MKVFSVCRLNQARSPFSQSIIQRFFPGSECESVGISAVFNHETNQEVRGIAAEWGLPPIKHLSESLESRKLDILESDLVILAEAKMEFQLRRIGYEGKSLSMNDPKIQKDFIPCDPLGLSLSKLKLELAKVAYCSIQGMRVNHGAMNQNPISVLIPFCDDDTPYAYAYAALEQKISGGVIIDADFRSPAAKKYGSDMKIEKVPIDDFDLLNISHAPDGKMFSPVREYGNPESILLSVGWRNFLDRISASSPVFVISAPRHTERKMLPDSYLCAVWSDKVTLINS
jgi:protein-tyrosine-phosphatase